MVKLDFRKRYTSLVQSLAGRHGYTRAMELAVGGDFEAIGVLERQLLIEYGLKPHDYLIDVGCGSGRLARAISDYLSGPYLGIDVEPELLAHARRLVQRPDWRFELTDGLSIPESDERADMVCFFSVFTHLLHEQSYGYLREAKRVLKPGHLIVFSFLEFSIPSHWAVFESSLADIGESKPLNMFISRDAIAAWADHLGLQIKAIHDGDKPHIPLPHPIVFDDGRVMEGSGNLGQSVCILLKP